MLNDHIFFGIEILVIILLFDIKILFLISGEHCDKYVEHYKKIFGDPPDYVTPQP